jgi:hypothetical protein
MEMRGSGNRNKSETGMRARAAGAEKGSEATAAPTLVAAPVTMAVTCAVGANDGSAAATAFGIVGKGEASAMGAVDTGIVTEIKDCSKEEIRGAPASAPVIVTAVVAMVVVVGPLAAGAAVVAPEGRATVDATICEPTGDKDGAAAAVVAATGDGLRAKIFCHCNLASATGNLGVAAAAEGEEDNWGVGCGTPVTGTVRRLREREPAKTCFGHEE